MADRAEARSRSPRKAQPLPKVTIYSSKNMSDLNFALQNLNSIVATAIPMKNSFKTTKHNTHVFVM